MSKPAHVKFIGNEKEYKLTCNHSDCHYCRDCEDRHNCNKKQDFQFTFGEIYEAYFLEYWQGVRESLHVKDNNGEISDFIPFEDFEVVEDHDNVLNTYEATVKCISDEYTDELFDIKHGKEYKAIGRDKDGYFLVLDESCDCYFYSSENFEIIDDPHGILSQCSLYYSYLGDFSKDEPDYIAAHEYSSRHRTQLEKDSICGCFYCLEIFSPSEIEEWLMSKYDKPGTALCPYCGIDSVIGESSSYPITKEFLGKMKKYWFEK